MEGKSRKSWVAAITALAIVATVSFFIGGSYGGTRPDAAVSAVLLERDALQSSLRQRTEERDALAAAHEELKAQLEGMQSELSRVSLQKEMLFAENEALKEAKAITIHKDLIDVAALDPRIEVELRYATEDNFMKRKVYPDNSRALLRTGTALKLLKASAIFEGDGYSLKIWDGYRPPAVQEILWSITPDPRFVADPRKGSNHSRGSAVDLTLVDRDGKELAMPTGHDEFSAEAGRNHTGHSEEVRRNLAYLTDVMRRCGFTTISSEWWHYDDADAAGYGIIDATFDEFD